MSSPDISEGTWTHRRVYILLGVLVFAFTQAGLYAGRYTAEDNFPENAALTSPSNSVSIPNSRVMGHVPQHPISKLMEEAETKFRKLLAKQSQTIEAAVAEYKKRYHRDPPKGFDAWWKFAQENNVRMVDEYDGLMDDLEPFWEMTGAEFRRKAVQAGQLPSVDLVRIRDGEAEAINTKPTFDDDDISMRAKSFLLMISKFQHTLPDMDFAVNARAEGRVLVPWENREYPNITQDSAGAISTIGGGLHVADWQGRGNAWEAYRHICPPNSPARRLMSSKRIVANDSTPYFEHATYVLGNDFKFARDVDGRYSFCNNPWAHYYQGHFFSDWRTVPVPFPILSPAKNSGYGDIKIPSHYYYGTTRRYTYAYDEVNHFLKEVDSMEIPWEKKTDKVFWRGATTGGGSSPPGYSPQYQRHRFVRLVSDNSTKNRTIVFADPPSSSNYVITRVPTNALNEEIMDVAFVSSVDHLSYPGGLQQQMLDYRFADAVQLRECWAHKYILDLDGMSYSGKFFAYLASDSAVIKSTVYREFFSDWIQPWLHYIPLSSSYKEIYNIHTYFSGATNSTLDAANSTSLNLSMARRRPLDGDRRLRRIARAGKQWRKTIGRQVDMEAYVYRLCLEYARLSADDRDSMNFTL
ncbi:hypothetical protein EW146_g1646 [Bondarzewia mesenterica]|uniref:Glycosyl transferase CAP10 domain-containing protein n=1 Tax=Bondarzewia mesenterica TaxID=1095465 RepID=A0A4S4M322_9AGAM|nr:hypothetical protein EW146_g1646 [Bondarzewia mesenterica]